MAMRRLGRSLRGNRAARRPTLSIVCGTHHPGPVVAEALRPLRSFADEIIVGADEAVTEDDLAWYSTVADRLSTYPFIGPDQFRGWLREQATGDWLLFLDGDEIPSQALIDGIAPLLEDRDVAAHLLRMWWVAPGGGHAIDSKPWSPEYHCRLVRNDDRLWFAGVKHSGPRTRGPARRSELSLLHLDLALQDIDARRRKVALYESQQFGHLTNGRSTNAVYYLPELSSDLQLRDLPTRDRVRVAEVLSARERTRRRPAAIRIDVNASVDDVRRTVPWQPFDDVDAQALIEVVDCPSSVRSASSVCVELRVTNLGQRKWPWGWDAAPAVRVSYHWSLDGEMVNFDGLRTVLTHPVPPGGAIELTAIVQVPEDARCVDGSNQLVFDVVADGDRWFGCETSVPVTVTPSARVELRDLKVRGLVPLDEVLRMRTALVFPGELERAMVESQAEVQASSDLDVFIQDLSMQESALDRAELDEVARLVGEERPACTLAFGSWTSTVLLAWLARRRGSAGISVISVNHDRPAAEYIRSVLRDHGLDHLVRIEFAPFCDVDVDGVVLRSYDPEIVRRVLVGHAPTLVLIGGTSQAARGSRFPILPTVQSCMASSARFVLAEAWQEEGLTIADRWSQRPAVIVHGIAPVGRGLLIGEFSGLRSVPRDAGADATA